MPRTMVSIAVAFLLIVWPWPCGLAVHEATLRKSLLGDELKVCEHKRVDLGQPVLMILQFLLIVKAVITCATGAAMTVAAPFWFIETPLLRGVAPLLQQHCRGPAATALTWNRVAVQLLSFRGG